jgi:hypothetical protein
MFRLLTEPSSGVFFVTKTYAETYVGFYYNVLKNYTLFFK